MCAWWLFLSVVAFGFGILDGQEGFQDGNAVHVLEQSRDFGLANSPTIAAKYSEQLQIKKEFAQEYLERNVHYYMDPACLEALELFYKKAAHVGALTSVRDLQFI